MGARPSSLPVINPDRLQCAEQRLRDAYAQLALINDREQRRADAIAKANLERFMPHQNRNKQTPRPNVSPVIHTPDPDWERFKAEYAAWKAANPGAVHVAFTGPTTRLERTCPKCHDTPPQGAAYCIECGEPL